MASIDLDTFFDGFGLRPETVLKIKELGFTAKTLMSNVDELPSLLESINQHHQLTLGEEWGIKGAAKKWQRGDNRSTFLLMCLTCVFQRKIFDRIFCELTAVVLHVFLST